MKQISARFIKCRDVKTPEYGTPGSNGLDFFIPNDVDFFFKMLPSGASIQIPSGIKVEMPDGYALIAMPKSGIGKRGILAGAPLIDSDYRGEIYLPLVNCSNIGWILEPGQKIIQFCLIEIPQLKLIEIQDEKLFSSTERGEKGFGSTGIN